MIYNPASIEVIGYPIVLAAPRTDMVSSGINGFWHDPYLWLNIWTIFGAIISALLQSNFSFKLKNVNRRIFSYYFVGGIIIGFGSTLAGGGNISNIYEATVTESVSGYVWIAILIIASIIFINFKHYHKSSK